MSLYSRAYRNENHSFPIVTNGELCSNTEECKNRARLLKSEENEDRYGMGTDEFEEKHLQDALIQNIAIPTPEFELIDRMEYEKLYPPIPVKLPLQERKIFTFIDNVEQQADYDADDDDQNFLDKKKIPISTFEKIIGWLEERTLRKKVPSWSDLLTSDVTGGLRDRVLTEIYDHWLDKRENRLYPLMPVLKSSASPTVFDPYAIFHKPVRTISVTRSLRKGNEKIYMKALKFQKASKIIKRLVADIKENAVQDHKNLRQRFSGFILQHRIGNEQLNLVDNLPVNQGRPMKQKLSASTSSTEECFGDDQIDEVYSFIRLRPEQKYYAPLPLL